MGAVMFYHLTQRPLVETLRMLVDKSLANGWRVWLGPEGSFLPHGLAGGEHDALQPVLLGLDGANTNAAQCVVAVHSAQVTPQDAAAMERVCILFDGYDEDALSHARGQWRALTGAGVSAQYWSEESGRWEKKAEA